MSRLSSLARDRRARSGGRWLVWMPALLAGALFYWTVALGLGGLSLLAVSALSGTDDGDAPEGAAQEPGEDPASDQAQDLASDAIVVHLQESTEAFPAEAKGADGDAVDREEDEGIEDVDDNPGASAPSSVEATAVEPAPGL